MLDQEQFQDARALVRRYAAEVREQAPPRIDEVPRTRSSDTVVLTILVVVAIVVGGVEAAVLLRPGTDATMLPPDAAVLQVEAEPCMRRMTAISRAIEAHLQEHGAVPRTLADLAGSLSEPAVEPHSGRPYAYVPDGLSYSLSCPDPGGHPASGGG